MVQFPVKALVACILGTVLLTSACAGVSDQYRYTEVVKAYPSGKVIVRLWASNQTGHPKRLSVMGAPYTFAVSARLNNGAALPASCAVKYRSATLHRADGSVEASAAPLDVPARLIMVGTGENLRQDPSGQASANLSRDALNIPYTDYLAAVDFSLQGCGAIDGDHRLREVLQTDYEKRRTNPVWEAMKN